VSSCVSKKAFNCPESILTIADHSDIRRGKHEVEGVRF
jgi:hypothetical protein